MLVVIDERPKRMAAPLSKGRQRPALRGFASSSPTALQPLERQPAFLHDCALLANSTQSLRYHRITQWRPIIQLPFPFSKAAICSGVAGVWYFSFHSP